MSEQLIIENFLGIKKVQIDINDFLVFIGPQASGKSVIAKLIHYFKTFGRELLFSIESYEKKYDFDKRLIVKFEEYFPPASWNNTAFEISYKNGDDEIELSKIESKQAKLKIKYSNRYVTKLNQGKNYLKKIKIKNDDEDQVNTKINYNKQYDARQHLYSILRKDSDPNMMFNQLFIPAGRSFFSNLQSSIFNFLSNNNALDPFLRDFGSYYENIKYRYDMKRPAAEKNNELYERVKKIVQEILKGKYYQEKGKDYLILDDGRKLNVLNCSSGQQEVLPLAMILSDIPFTRYIGGGLVVYIEEPEAHLFPIAQKQIVELLGLISNVSINDIRIIITTHSPYILASFNNLIQASNIDRCIDEKKQKELYNIIRKDQMIPIEKINAYSLNDGKIKNLISKENELINTNIIDDVSNIISEQFNKLLEMEC